MWEPTGHGKSGGLRLPLTFFPSRSGPLVTGCRIFDFRSLRRWCAAGLAVEIEGAGCHRFTYRPLCKVTLALHSTFLQLPSPRLQKLLIVPAQKRWHAHRGRKFPEHDDQQLPCWPRTRPLNRLSSTPTAWSKLGHNRASKKPISAVMLEQSTWHKAQKASVT